MTRPWFRRWGWIYRPVSLCGWAIVAMAAVFCVTVFRAVDRHSHSVSDTMYGVFPYIVCIFMLVGWLASRTCELTGSGRKYF